MARSKNKKIREYTERIVWQTEMITVVTKYPGEYNLYIAGSWHGIYRTSDEAVAAAHKWLQDEIKHNA